MFCTFARAVFTETKGCSLPIEIQITIKYPEITYILRKKKIKDFSVLSEYLLNVNSGKSSSIEVKDIDEASNPSGDDLSQSIDKSDYLSIAKRVHSWMDSHDSVPNYVGVSQVGVADLSPDKMLKLFTLATLDYAVTGDLPVSVQI